MMIIVDGEGDYFEGYDKNFVKSFVKIRKKSNLVGRIYVKRVLIFLLTA